MDKLDLNNMTLEEIEEYCHQRDVWLLNLLIKCDGFEKTCEILAENGKI